MIQEFKDHVKLGEEYTCDKCGSSMTNRSESETIFIDCGCGNKVELKWQ